MRLGGFQKTTLVDFPGRVASIIFVAGCNMRCHYCYNPDIVFGRAKEIDEDSIFSELKRRIRYVDSVVVTGGEPTIWPDLPDFISRLKDIKLKVKLDTNGTNPKMLSRIINENLVDYIAMDVKANKSKYHAVSGLDGSFDNILKSIELIKSSSLEYEFRTTVAPGMLPSDIEEIAIMIYPAKRWFLQKFLPMRDLVDKNEFKREHMGSKDIERAAKIASNIQRCTVRGL